MLDSLFLFLCEPLRKFSRILDDFSRDFQAMKRKLGQITFPYLLPSDLGFNN